MNYPTVSSIAVSCLVVSFSAFVFLSESPSISVVIALGTGVMLLLGTFIAARNFDFFIERAKFMAQEEFPQSEKIESAGTATGVKLLDSVVNEHRESIGSMEDTIAEMQEEINLLNMRYKILTDNLAAAVVVHDEDGIIGYCSPYTEVLFGYPLSEIYESEDDFFLRIIHDEDKAVYKRALGYAEMGEAYRYRFRFFHKSNIEMWAEARMVPIFDEQGAISSSLSVMIDVTQSVKYERQVEEKNHDLQDFTYMASHDLKAPIVTIKGMLGVLEDEGTDELPEESQQAIEHIGKAIERLELLVSGVLEYSKLSTRELSFDSVNLNHAIDEVISDHKVQIEESGATISRPETLPPVMGDHLAVYQIFSNLIGNAIKYRDQQKQLSIAIELSDSSPRSFIVTVADNGQGIPKDQQEAIFRPFKRAHSEAIEGSGIGLACVKKLIERLGGSVALVDSDQGCRFELRFPKALERYGAESVR